MNLWNAPGQAWDFLENAHKADPDKGIKIPLLACKAEANEGKSWIFYNMVEMQNNNSLLCSAKTEHLGTRYNYIRRRIAKKEGPLVLNNEL